MKRFIVICLLAGSSMISPAQTLTEPHGEGSVVFEAAGGKWQRAVITDQLTGETSFSYSLGAEPSAADNGTMRHPWIAFSCQQPDAFDGLRIQTGTAIAAYSLGWARVSTHTDDQEFQTGTAEIAANGSDFLIRKGIVISHFLAHKKFVIRFSTASGNTITDEYLIEGLSIESLKTDCPDFFKPTTNLLRK